MPTVPLLPTVAPEGGRTPEFHEGVVEGAFGERTGAALQQAGQDVSRLGDQTFQTAQYLQNLQNETEALNANTRYGEESVKLRAKFMSLEGANASPEALTKYQGTPELHRCFA